MKIPQFLLTAVVTAILALEAWTLNQVITQGQDIAAIKAELTLRDHAQK